MRVLVEGPAEGGTQDRAGLSCRLVPGEPCRDLPGAVRALRWGQPFGPGRSRLTWGLWCPVPGRAVLGTPAWSRGPRRPNLLVTEERESETEEEVCRDGCAVRRLPGAWEGGGRVHTGLQGCAVAGLPSRLSTALSLT